MPASKNWQALQTMPKRIPNEFWAYFAMTPRKGIEGISGAP